MRANRADLSARARVHEQIEPAVPDCYRSKRGGCAPCGYRGCRRRQSVPLVPHDGNNDVALLVCQRSDCIVPASASQSLCQTGSQATSGRRPIEPDRKRARPGQDQFRAIFVCCSRSSHAPPGRVPVRISTLAPQCTHQTQQIEAAGPPRSRSSSTTSGRLPYKQVPLGADGCRDTRLRRSAFRAPMRTVRRQSTRIAGDQSQASLYGIDFRSPRRDTVHTAPEPMARSFSERGKKTCFAFRSGARSLMNSTPAGHLVAQIRRAGRGAAVRGAPRAITMEHRPSTGVAVCHDFHAAIP
jgi:hypothetical protein